MFAFPECLVFIVIYLDFNNPLINIHFGNYIGKTHHTHAPPIRLGEVAPSESLTTLVD